MPLKILIYNRQNSYDVADGDYNILSSYWIQSNTFTKYTQSMLIGYYNCKANTHKHNDTHLDESSEGAGAGVFLALGRGGLIVVDGCPWGQAGGGLFSKLQEENEMEDEETGYWDLASHSNLHEM